MIYPHRRYFPRLRNCHRPPTMSQPFRWLCLISSLWPTLCQFGCSKNVRRIWVAPFLCNLFNCSLQSVRCIPDCLQIIPHQCATQESKPGCHWHQTRQVNFKFEGYIQVARETSRSPSDRVFLSVNSLLPDLQSVCRESQSRAPLNQLLLEYCQFSWWQSTLATLKYWPC